MLPDASPSAVRAVLGERGDDPALAARTAEELRAEWSSPSSSFSASASEGGAATVGGSDRLRTVMQVGCVAGSVVHALTLSILSMNQLSLQNLGP